MQRSFRCGTSLITAFYLNYQSWKKWMKMKQWGRTFKPFCRNTQNVENENYSFLGPLTLNSTSATFQDLVLFLADWRNSNPFLHTDERFPVPTSNVKFCFDQGYELLEHLKCSKCCTHVSFQKLSRPGLWPGVRTVGTLQPAELSQEVATWHKWLPYIKRRTIYAGVFHWCFMIVWKSLSLDFFGVCWLYIQPVMLLMRAAVKISPWRNVPVTD